LKKFLTAIRYREYKFGNNERDGGKNRCQGGKRHNGNNQDLG